MKKQAEERLGMAGRMIAGSKSGYCKAYPQNVPIFNSNLAVKTGAFGKKAEKIWHGDLDLTEDCAKLRKLSEDLEKPLYVIREMDGRFGNEENPILDEYVVKVEKDKVTIGSYYENYYMLEEIDNKICVKMKTKETV